MKTSLFLKGDIERKINLMHSDPQLLKAMSQDFCVAIKHFHHVSGATLACFQGLFLLRIYSS